MYGVYLKLNQFVSIQYEIGSGFFSHKSVLYCVSAYGMNLVLENGAPTAVTYSYKSLLTQFFPDTVDTDTVISNILTKNPLIKVHPENNCP